MPTIFSHAVAGLCLGAWFVRPDTSRTLLAAGAICAVVPDLDVVGLAVGFGLDHPVGHRGLSHSMVFAATLAGAVTAGTRWYDARLSAARTWLYLFLATLSHGILDAMTNGGRGVAFFAPFSAERYHFPFTPIEVSPIGVSRFFTARGVEIMTNELVWIWAPALLFAFVGRWVRPRAVPSAS